MSDARELLRDLCESWGSTADWGDGGPQRFNAAIDAARAYLAARVPAPPAEPTERCAKCGGEWDNGAPAAEPVAQQPPPEPTVYGLCPHCGSSLVAGHNCLAGICFPNMAAQLAQRPPGCKTDPRAPHGFLRSASFDAGHYVCECEHWEPPAQQLPLPTLPWSAERVAQRFHEIYEAIAPSFGYATREASAKPWADVPEQNRRLMIATCEGVLKELSAAQQPEAPTLVDDLVARPAANQSARTTSPISPTVPISVRTSWCAKRQLISPRTPLGRPKPAAAAEADTAEQPKDDARDAKRYRWLTGRLQVPIGTSGVPVGLRFNMDSRVHTYFDSAQLDAAIDAAIASQGPKGEGMIDGR